MRPKMSLCGRVLFVKADAKRRDFEQLKKIQEAGIRRVQRENAERAEEVECGHVPSLGIHGGERNLLAAVTTGLTRASPEREREREVLLRLWCSLSLERERERERERFCWGPGADLLGSWCRSAGALVPICWGPGAVLLPESCCGEAHGDRRKRVSFATVDGTWPQST